jgi:hypothetical protein
MSGCFRAFGGWLAGCVTATARCSLRLDLPRASLIGGSLDGTPRSRRRARRREVQIVSGWRSNTSSNACRSAMSTSGVDGVRPRSARLVTP